MAKKKTSPSKSRKTSRQSQESSGSGRKKTSKKIAAKESSKSSRKKSEPSPRKTARKSSTEKEPVKGRAVKGPPVKGRAAKGQTVKGRTVKGPPAKGRTVKGRAVKGKELPAKKLPAKGRQPPAKGKKLSAKQVEALRRSEANARRRALYAEKKEAAAKAQAAEAKRRAKEAKQQAVKAQKQTVAAEKAKETAKADVSRLLEKLRKSVDKQVQLEQEAKAKPPALPKKKKKKRKKLPSRVFVIDTSKPPDKGWVYSEKEEPEEKRTRVSGKGNKHSFKYAEVFEAVFRGKTRRLPYNMDEVPVTRFGITVRVQDIQDVNAAVDDMRAWLNLSMPAGFSAHIEKEADAIVVHLNMGDYKEPSNAPKAIQQIRRNSDIIAAMVDRARSYSEDGDDFIWFPHWDWDSDYDTVEKSP